MVYVKRRDHETTGAMLRRFSRRVQASGILLRARRARFYASRPTRRQQRERALARTARLQERSRLAKLGRLPSRPAASRRRRP